MYIYRWLSVIGSNPTQVMMNEPCHGKTHLEGYLDDFPFFGIDRKSKPEAIQNCFPFPKFNLKHNFWRLQSAGFTRKMNVTNPCYMS